MDSLQPDLEKTHSALKLLHDSVTKVWQESLTEGHVAMSRRTRTPKYLPGDVVFLKYPSKVLQGYWKYGIVLKQLTVDTYLIRYLSKRSKDGNPITHGTITLDQRMFILLYRPNPEKDKNFLDAWVTFAKKFPDRVTKEKNRTADNKSLDEMFKKATAHPPPPGVDPMSTAPTPPVVDSDPLEDLVEQFPAGGETQDEIEAPR